MILTKAAMDVLVGDVLDLEGDPFADPNRDNPSLQCEYQTVIEVESETPYCVRLAFDGLAVGFPYGHHLRYVRHEEV
jgi:hypothetical protein